jgi:thiamine biosynthesis lipoprotein
MRRCRPLLGTFVEIEADDPGAIAAGFAAVERVHRLMSAHEPGSDVSRINRFAHLGSVTVHGWTALVLERALAWSRASAGAFDILRAGKSAVESGLVPRHSDQPRPEASHWTWLEVQGRSVRLLKPGCIDLGGIAKGFAVDQAAAAMRAVGAAAGLVNAGGDLVAFGPEPRRVVVPDPLSRRPLVELSVRESAVATSALLGGSARHLQGESRWLSVTVRATGACDADALTKIAWAAPSGLGRILAEARASGFGIGPGGEVEELGTEALAA